MDQLWFEMHDIKRLNLKRLVWIPLKASFVRKKEGKIGFDGYLEEYFGSHCIFVPIEEKGKIAKLRWDDIGIDPRTKGYYCIDKKKYIPAPVFDMGTGESIGFHAVLKQFHNSIEKEEWHILQDLILTLGLKKEGDIWVCPNEDYNKVIRLKLTSDGEPCLLEMRAEYLKDYLCARNMILYSTSFYSREQITPSAKHIKWENGCCEENLKDVRWKGTLQEIHEGGDSFGSELKIIHIERTDINDDEDIPDISALPTDNNIETKSTIKKFSGRKLYRIIGELWRNEYFNPGKISIRIKNDNLPDSIFFITDNEESKESKVTLRHGGKWLWFKPDVVNALMNHRGGFLKWYTKDTGSVACLPDSGVHFGINDLGLVVVYAKDIVLLQEWQQKIWSAFNICPDGGISNELYQSQVRASPARTHAPESLFKLGLFLIHKFSLKQFKQSFIFENNRIPELLKSVHRFRAINKDGLYALAKDLSRLTADVIDKKIVQKFVKPPKDKNWGSLKSLEKLLAVKTGQASN